MTPEDGLYNKDSLTDISFAINVTMKYLYSFVINVTTHYAFKVRKKAKIRNRYN